MDTASVARPCALSDIETAAPYRDIAVLFIFHGEYGTILTLSTV